ncbi:hypothetical protein COCON_G00067890 [Conger conger]|uniref:Ig-like domain-containing protein n=1 Tax=Conger conger TaxID=82655 RepID=A0A9Q1I487_CONCO|nr:CD226 antigen [Conger conger]KAJ8279723.1 hypothetical protein COCON_G00067890 [Conger conger]
MKKIQKDCWYFMVLMILLGSIRDACSEKLVDSMVRLERSITLECLCPWSGNLSMIAWVKMPGKKQVAAFHPEFGLATSDEYKGRVNFLTSSRMDGTITILNTTASDAGLYQCSVQTFPRGSWIKNILVKHLVDIDLSMADPKGVKKGNTFLLNCNYADMGSVYNVTFEKVGEKGIDTIARCSRVEGRVEETFVGVDFKERALVNCSDVLGISLRLLDVTEQDEGFYSCHFSAEASGQTTTVSLTVSTEGSSMSISPEIYMYIFIGSGVLGLILIILATTLICWHKRKKRAKVRAKLHPMQRRLINNYEQAALYDKMKKKNKHQEESQVYVNIPRQTKRKT